MGRKFKREEHNEGLHVRQLLHKPRTRRDFMAQGFLGLSACFIPGPGLLSKALAACEDFSPEKTCIPYIGLDLVGGLPLAGTFLVGKNGGPSDLLSSYDRLGWNPRAPRALVEGMGTPLASVSSIVTGINQFLSAEAKANLKFMTLCHVAQDDTMANPLSPLTLISKAGALGRHIGNGLGIFPTASGGFSDVVLRDGSLQPVTVQRLEDVQGAVSFGPAFVNTSAPRIKDMYALNSALAKLQLKRLENNRDYAKLAEAVNCAYKQNVKYSEPITGLDPRGNDVMKTLYGIDAQTPTNTSLVISAAIVMNVLNKNSGPGVISIPACDYHDQGPQVSEAKDLEVGQHIGRIIQAAHLLKTPVFLHIYGDGSMSADPGTRYWRGGDFGERSLSVVAFYDPDGPAEIRKAQIGQYTDGQTADRGSLIGDKPAMVAYAVFANYLNAHGRLGEFRDIAGSGFPESALDSVIMFERAKGGA